MYKLFLGAIGASILSGCATQGTSTADYNPGTASKVTNEKAVNRPQNVVWDELVRELSKSFFVINNIERESRIINVSFNSNSPEQYVDCGRTQRTYTEGDKRESYNYAVAERSTYKVAGQKQPNPSFKNYAVITRETSLDGRANIYVAPDPSNPARTIVSVNTRYILSVKTRGDGFIENSYGQVVNRSPVPEQAQSIIFNTNQPGSLAAGQATIVCAGLGKLEADVLTMVR